MRRNGLATAALVAALLIPGAATAQSFRATFLPPDAAGATPALSHAQRLRPTSMPGPLRTHRDRNALAAGVDCAMAVPANPDVDQRMTLLHPPPDIKFSMRLIVVPPCKR
jgi:hypothetical protein